MSKTQAEYQAAYRARQKKLTPKTNAPLDLSNTNARVNVGPLDVYSEDRWGKLQNMGYRWDASKGLATRESTDNIAVTLPGDPAYGELGTNKCKGCGMDTGHMLVAKCNKCCDDGVPNAPTTPVKTFDDLPLDVQRSIDKHCSEANNGDRAGSHNRAAMTERAIAYQTATVKVEEQVTPGARSYIDHCTEGSGVEA